MPVTRGNNPTQPKATHSSITYLKLVGVHRFRSFAGTDEFNQGQNMPGRGRHISGSYVPATSEPDTHPLQILIPYPFRPRSLVGTGSDWTGLHWDGPLHAVFVVAISSHLLCTPLLYLKSRASCHYLTGLRDRIANASDRPVKSAPWPSLPSSERSVVLRSHVATYMLTHSCERSSSLTSRSGTPCYHDDPHTH